MDGIVGFAMARGLSPEQTARADEARETALGHFPWLRHHSSRIGDTVLHVWGHGSVSKHLHRLEDGTFLALSEFVQPRDGERVERRSIRFRTMGDATITGAIESEASDLDSIIKEVALASDTERGNRADDKVSETSMEDRKREGYF